MLALDLLFVLISLTVLGEPLRSLSRRFTRTFKNLDILEIFVVDIYLGGFLLYLLALIPLGLFNLFVIATLLIVSAVLDGVKILRLVGSVRLSEAVALVRISAFHLVCMACVFLTFLLLFWMELLPMNHIVLGSIDDASLHSLFTQLLLNNQMIPATHMPFLPEGLIFPQGHTTFFGFASILLEWVSAKSVLYVTALFISLSVLGAYFLGKEISGKPDFGAVLAVVTAFVATHPRYLTWGGNAFIVAFPFFMVCLGIFFGRISVVEKTKTELLTEGLFLGYLGVMYLTALAVMMLLLACQAALNMVMRKTIMHSIRQYSLLFFAGVLFIFPSFIKVLSWYSMPMHNIGLPNDVQVNLSNLPPSDAFWALNEIMTQRFPLNFYTPFLIVLGVVALTITQKRASFERKLLLMIFGTFLVPVALLSLSNHVLLVREVTGAATCVMVFIPFNLLVAFFVFDALSFSSSAQPSNRLHSKIRRGFIVSALLLLLFLPFVLSSVLFDETYITGGYNVHAVTSQNDYSLMLWMRDNLNRTSTRVLVNRYDAGRFIPSVANIVAIYPYSGSQLSASYVMVTDSLHLGRLTSVEYDFMKKLNVTHVFVGSAAGWWWTGDHRWYAKFFLDNPNFELVKNIGESYLFRVVYGHRNTVFQDDFNYDDVFSHRWSAYVPDNILSDGIGSVSSPSPELTERPYLRINAQKQGNASFYWYSIIKDVYLGDYADATDNITIQFDFQVDSGFCLNDTLMIIISSEDWQKQIYFATSKNIGVKQEWLAQATPNGVNEFNLSQIWLSIHESLPPNTFHLQIVNHDTDYVENIAYVGNITITINTP